MLPTIKASLVLSLLLTATGTPLASARIERRAAVQIRQLPKQGVLPIIIHHVDPAAPSISQQAVFAGEEHDLQLDEPNFGSTCVYSASNPYNTCGDYFAEETGVDHGLFCSPAGVCAGKGAACGSTESCLDGQSSRVSEANLDVSLTRRRTPTGLSCDYNTHRCVITSTLRLSVAAKKVEERRKSSNCPGGTESCAAGIGGFECVDTLTDDRECGACANFGGVDCSQIEGALATSCRDGSCVVSELSFSGSPS